MGKAIYITYKSIHTLRNWAELFSRILGYLCLNGERSGLEPYVS